MATDLGRLEACLRTDTKMETQDRKSHEADAGCAFLVINNFKDRGGLLPTPVVTLDSFGLDDDRGVPFLPCLRTGGDRACHVAARQPKTCRQGSQRCNQHGDDYFCNFFLLHNFEFLILAPDLVAICVVIWTELMHRIAEERTDLRLRLELRLQFRLLRRVTQHRAYCRHYFRKASFSSDLSCRGFHI